MSVETSVFPHALTPHCHVACASPRCHYYAGVRSVAQSDDSRILCAFVGVTFHHGNPIPNIRIPMAVANRQCGHDPTTPTARKFREICDQHPHEVRQLFPLGKTVAFGRFERLNKSAVQAINILHHYEIRPNAYFSSVSSINATNLPYVFPPVLRETIGSPVRLFAASDLAIGPYGTAVWIDSHTEDYFFRADRGQRLAGKFSPYVGTEEGEEVELSDQIANATATSVYSYHEEDSWVRIALDEEEGRIFLGRVDGLITVLEYA